MKKFLKKLGFKDFEPMRVGGIDKDELSNESVTKKISARAALILQILKMMRI